MFNEHTRQDNTSEQSKKSKLLPKATMPVVPEAQEISDEELDLAAGGSAAGGAGGTWTTSRPWGLGGAGD